MKELLWIYFHLVILVSYVHRSFFHPSSSPPPLPFLPALEDREGLAHWSIEACQFLPQDQSSGLHITAALPHCPIAMTTVH